MDRKLTITLLFLGLLIPSAARAHDPSKHKGKGVQGEIVSIDNDRIELKTSTGTKIVKLNDKTKLEHGSQKMAREDLKKGNQVKVIGTTLASGEIVAREVLMTGPDDHSTHKDAGSAKQKDPAHNH
jgi:RNase P/RNase MRP subunit p29